MALALICALVVLLYARTVNYNYVIDDNVKRDGYMYEVPLEGPQPDYFKKRPPKLYRIFMIGMHCVNVSVIYLLWGWAPALLFAVHPIGVWGTAWVTGNYYATTAYFCLIGYYLLTVFPNVYGALGAMALYAVALNSTVCCISFPFIFLFPFMGTPWGLTLLFPLVTYLNGKRFRTGIKTRLDFTRGKPVDTRFTWRRLLSMTKVVARYIYVCLVPEKQGFFRSFGRHLHDRQKNYDWIHSVNAEFWTSLALCLVTFIGGMLINPVGTIWFFTVIMLHSQWNLTGQFFAERYAYLPIVGLCIVAGTILQHYPIAMTAVVTYLVYRTNNFIPVWKNQQVLWENDIRSFPHNPSVHNNLAQWQLNSMTSAPLYRVNETAMLLQKAELLDPNSWEVSMNMACFAVRTGDLERGIKMTAKAIKQLEPISMGSGQVPMEKLIDQKKRLEKSLEEKKAKASKQTESRLGESLSHSRQTKEEENGTSKEGSSKEGILEPIGASVA